MSGRGFLERAWECALASGDFLEEFGDDVTSGAAFDASGVVEDEAVAEDGVGDGLDVFEAGVDAVVEEGAGFDGGGHAEGGAGAGSEFDACGGGGLARVGGVDETSDVVSDDVGEEDAAGEGEEGGEFRGVHDWGDGGFDAEFAVADDAFEGGGVVAEDFEFEEEAVDLGFWERVGAFEFDWVLGGEDEEGIGEVVAGAEDGDAAFLHGFEEGALGFGARSVDFVGEDEVGEDGAWLEDEGAAFWGFAEDWVAGDIAGEEVWGELDAAGGEAEGFGETFDEFGFAEAREALEEKVAAGEETGEGEGDQFFFTEEDGFEGAAQPRQRFCGGGDIGFARIVWTGGAHWRV